MLSMDYDMYPHIKDLVGAYSVYLILFIRLTLIGKENVESK